MLSPVTVSPVITAFHSCCLSHHVFDQVNLWPAWVGFETTIFWQCSPGTVETQRLYPLCHGPWGKAVITGDTVTGLSISIWGCSKITWRRSEVKFGRNVVKEETIQKLPRWGGKVRKKLILRLRSLISKWFQLNTIFQTFHKLSSGMLVFLYLLYLGTLTLINTECVRGNNSDSYSRGYIVWFNVLLVRWCKSNSRRIICNISLPDWSKEWDKMVKVYIRSDYRGMSLCGWKGQ